MSKRGCVKNQCYARVCRCFSPKNKERLRGAAAWNALRDFFFFSALQYTQTVTMEDSSFFMETHIIRISTEETLIVYI